MYESKTYITYEEVKFKHNSEQNSIQGNLQDMRYESPITHMDRKTIRFFASSTRSWAVTVCLPVLPGEMSKWCLYLQLGIITIASGFPFGYIMLNPTYMNKYAFGLIFIFTQTPAINLCISSMCYNVTSFMLSVFWWAVNQPTFDICSENYL